MENLLSLNFWLNLRPGLMGSAYFRAFFIAVAVFFILIFVFGLIKSRNKKNLYSRFWSNVYYFCMANAIFGAILLFFTYEMIPFLSARFWFLLWGIEIIIWLVYTIRILIGIPERKKQLEQEKAYKKYIP
ncbi:MAG: hypothetical protein V1825_01505 [Candidatus Falkowbacteria bacterium]